MMATYDIGATVPLAVTITDSLANPINPTSVTVVITLPDNSTASPTVANPPTVTGSFTATYVPTLAGLHSVNWSATATGASWARQLEFVVDPALSALGPADLSTFLGVTVDTARGTQLIKLATQLCQSVVDPLPAGADAVVLAVAARAYSNPTNAQQQTIGPYSAGYGAVGGGLWLTTVDERTLRRLNGGGGAFTIDLTPAKAGQGLPLWDQGVYVDDTTGALVGSFDTGVAPYTTGP